MAKLTKAEAKAHARALELQDKDVLTYDERLFVLENWQGRALPSWDGCLRLTAGEYFLTQPHPHSFDSRYFGPVLRCDILGVARPIWTWNLQD